MKTKLFASIGIALLLLVVIIAITQAQEDSDQTAPDGVLVEQLTQAQRSAVLPKSVEGASALAQWPWSSDASQSLTGSPSDTAITRDTENRSWTLCLALSMRTSARANTAGRYTRALS